jgi:RNA polymerase sigma-70 factor (ECF subfamily)
MSTHAPSLPLSSLLTEAKQNAEPKDFERGLIARAKNGDRSGFDQLVEIHGAAILRLALRITRSKTDAQDIFQDTFLKAYSSLHFFREECSFSTWLHRIATNFCIALLRSRLRQQKERTADYSDNQADFFDTFPSCAADPERAAMSAQIGERLGSAVAALNPRQRVVFELRYYEGLPLRTISELIGTTEETVKNALFRGTKKLRAELTQFL